MIDRPGIIQDLQAMMERASREATRHYYDDLRWDNAFTFYHDCIAFVRELEQREAPLMQVWNKWPGNESIEEILDALKT